MPQQIQLLSLFNLVAKIKSNMPLTFFLKLCKMATGLGARTPWELTEGKKERGTVLWPNLAFKHETWNTG